MKNNKYIIWLLIAIICPLITLRGENLKEIHKKNHSEQLANIKSAIDKTVINEFIQNEILEKENVNETSNENLRLISDLIGEAKTHLGKKYRSGGKGPHNFDCSGFSSFVFKQFGYKLSASARSQYLQGEEIPIDELRAGDLVFFHGRSGKNGVGHVGIVVESDNDKGTFKFIHASVSKGIKIDISTMPYYKQRYVGAKRIIKD